jgi:hypothetical protein
MAYCKNAGTKFNTCTDLVLGANVTITMKAYSQINGIGTLLASQSATIQIIKSTPPIVPTVQPPVAPSFPVAIPAPVIVPAPVSAPVGEAITGLRLMYTGVNPSVAVMSLTFDTVNVADLLLLALPSAQFNIDVLAASNVKSISFSNNRIESAAPFSYCGDSGGNFYSCDNLILGANVTITFTAYAAQYGQGAFLGSRSTTIQIIRTTPPVAPTPPTPAPVASPVIPPVPGCQLPGVSLTRLF